MTVTLQYYRKCEKYCATLSQLNWTLYTNIILKILKTLSTIRRFFRTNKKNRKYVFLTAFYATPRIVLTTISVEEAEFFLFEPNVNTVLCLTLMIYVAILKQLLPIGYDYVCGVLLITCITLQITYMFHWPQNLSSSIVF